MRSTRYLPVPLSLLSYVPRCEREHDEYKCEEAWDETTTILEDDYSDLAEAVSHCNEDAYRAIRALLLEGTLLGMNAWGPMEFWSVARRVSNR